MFVCVSCSGCDFCQMGVFSWCGDVRKFVFLLIHIMQHFYIIIEEMYFFCSIFS